MKVNRNEMNIRIAEKLVGKLGAELIQLTRKPSRQSDIRRLRDLSGVALGLFGDEGYASRKIDRFGFSSDTERMCVQRTTYIRNFRGGK